MALEVYMVFEIVTNDLRVEIGTVTCCALAQSPAILSLSQIIG